MKQKTPVRVSHAFTEIRTDDLVYTRQISKLERVTEFIDDLPAAIYTCDRSGKIDFFNQAAVELWGRIPEIGKDMWCGSWKIYNSDGTPLASDSCPMALALKEARAVSGAEVILERPDGRRLNVLLHPKPLFDSAGNIRGAVNMIVDVTDQRKKELQLYKSKKKYQDLSKLFEKRVEERTLSFKKSEARYHMMVEEVENYAIILLDPAGNILNWNAGAQKIKGYTEKEIIGKNIEIFYLPKDRKSKLRQQLIDEASNNGNAKHEGWRLRKNGTKFWGLIIITALYDSDKNIIGFSKVTRDFTERKLAEDKLLLSTKEIAFRNKQLEEFACITSHDLQEPLRKICTYSSMLENQIDDKDTALKTLGKIDAAAKRMSALIQEILQYSEISISKGLFEMTNLNELLENIKIDYELLIAEKEVQLIHNNMPEVQGIPVQLQQLFFNLIGNAIKFSSESPVIEINCEKALKSEVSKIKGLNPAVHYMKITVKDNGIGFDCKDADRIFKLFQRLNTNQPGSGIGLALCKKIIENHQGHIAVHSEINKGSAFTLFFPDKK